MRAIKIIAILIIAGYAREMFPTPYRYWLVLAWLAVLVIVVHLVQEKRFLTGSIIAIGLLMNSTVVLANKFCMPLVGVTKLPNSLKEGFYFVANENTRLPLLADQHVLIGFSIGDLVLITGMIMFYWLKC